MKRKCSCFRRSSGDPYRNVAIALACLAAALFASRAAMPQQAQEALKFEPGCGPAGSLVHMTVTKGRPAVRRIEICSDGQCRNADFTGETSPIAFAVPADLKGDALYNVRVSYEKEFLTGEEPPTDDLPFRVLSGLARHLEVDGFELAPHRASGAEQPELLELVVYGSGFVDLDSSIILDGQTYKGEIPGFAQDGKIELQQLPSLCGTDKGSCFSPACIEKVRVALIPASAGSGQDRHRILVTGKSGSSRRPLEVPFPQRDLLLKVDRISLPMAADEGIFPGGVSQMEPQWPTAVSARLGELGSLRRPFSELGYRIDLPKPETVAWHRSRDQPVKDCTDRTSKSPGLYLSDVVEFAMKHGKEPDLPPGTWYVHTTVAGHLLSEDTNLTPYGLYLSALPSAGLDHREIAIFSQEVCSDRLLRTFIHELGHALNLTHCDGDDFGLTLMNKSDCLDSAAWNFRFSSQASKILTDEASAGSWTVPAPTTPAMPEALEGDRECCRFKGKPAPPAEVGTSRSSDTAAVQDNAPGGPLGDSPPMDTANSTGSGLEFTLSAPPSDVVYGQPVMLTATLTNRGTATANVFPLFDPAYGFTTYTLQNREPDAAPRPLLPFYHLDGEAKPRELKPGESVEHQVAVSFGESGYLFAPGTYRITAVFRGAKTRLDVPALTISSPSMDLVIHKPAGPAQAELAKFEAEPRTGLFFLLHGGSGFGDLPAQLEAKLADAKAEQVSSLTQDTDVSLGEYWTRAVAAANPSEREAALHKALSHFEAALSGPPLATSTKVRLHAGTAEAKGGLGDLTGVEEEIQTLRKEFPLDLGAGAAADRADQFRLDLGHTELPIDIGTLRHELGRRCREGADWTVEPTRNPPVVRVSGPKVKLANRSPILARGLAGLTLLRGSDTEQIFAVGLDTPAGLYVQSSALELRVKLKVNSVHETLSRGDVGPWAPKTGVNVTVPILQPCFLPTPGREELSLHLDPDSLAKIDHWRGKGALRVNLEAVLPDAFSRYGAKVSSPSILTAQ